MPKRLTPERERYIREWIVGGKNWKLGSVSDAFLDLIVEIDELRLLNSTVLEAIEIQHKKLDLAIQTIERMHGNQNVKWIQDTLQRIRDPLAE